MVVTHGNTKQSTTSMIFKNLKDYFPFSRNGLKEEELNNYLDEMPETGQLEKELEIISKMDLKQLNQALTDHEKKMPDVTVTNIKSKANLYNWKLTKVYLEKRIYELNGKSNGGKSRRKKKRTKKSKKSKRKRSRKTRK